MFFKSLLSYQLSKPINIDTLNQQLSQYPARPCGTQELATLGFKPFSENNFIWQVEGFTLLRLEKTEKIIPAAVVAKKTKTEVSGIEQCAGVKLGKKAIERIKSRIIYKMAEVAFEKTSTYDVVLTNEHIMVNSSSHSVAEACLAMLRKAVESLPVYPLVRVSLTNTLTGWVTDGVPEAIALMDEFKLLGLDGEIIQFKSCSVEDESVSDMTERGHMVDELSIMFDARVRFSINSEGAIKRIKFSDIVTDQNDDIPADDELARFDADFIINCNELQTLVTWLKGVCSELQQAESN